MLLRCQFCVEDFHPSVDVDDAPTFVLMLMLYKSCVSIDDDDLLMLY
jgi:hypothetical protein